jgi:hypothetical protein
MAKAQIFWDKGIQAYRLKMQWDKTRSEKVVEFLKKNVPHSERTYDPSTHIWTFTESYLDGTVKLLQLIFGNQEVATVTKAQVEAAQQPPRSNTGVLAANSPLGDTCYQFMKSIPYEAARQAYRRAAQLMHPDINREGDLGDMSKVNALWTKIEKEVYGQ